MDLSSAKLAECNREEIKRIVGYLNELLAKTVQEMQQRLTEHEEKLSLLEPLLDSKDDNGKSSLVSCGFFDEDSVDSDGTDFLCTNR